MKTYGEQLKELSDKAQFAANVINRDRYVDFLVNGGEYEPIEKEDTEEWLEYMRAYDMINGPPGTPGPPGYTGSSGTSGSAGPIHTKINNNFKKIQEKYRRMHYR